MTDESPISIWPLPKFCFSVSINGTAYPFQEVTGLETETDVIEYRHGDSKLFSTIKMPGRSKYGNVTAKKGIVNNDEQFSSWYQQHLSMSIRRQSVIISLLDENGNPVMSWTLHNAWLARIAGADLQSDGNEVAVESIEFAHEGITVQNHS
jgi:phage tail-like protein